MSFPDRFKETIGNGGVQQTVKVPVSESLYYWKLLNPDQSRFALLWICAVLYWIISDDWLLIIVSSDGHASKFIFIAVGAGSSLFSEIDALVWSHSTSSKHGQTSVRTTY